MTLDELPKEDRDAWWCRRMELLIWFGPYLQSGTTSDLQSGIRVAQAAASRPQND
jgi:hypothetical protein